MRNAIVFGFALLSAAGFAVAGEVKLTGVHNCCGGCKNGITKALNGAGAGKVEVTGKAVSFTADDADKALAALYAAGYAGKIEGAAEPVDADARGYKAKELKFDGLHNCCGSCDKGIKAALSKIEGAKVESKAKTTTMTVSSDKELDAEDVLKALRAGGFNAKLAQ
jgi:copper chaperone CopZ